jgi:hypothetical protein
MKEKEAKRLSLSSAEPTRTICLTSCATIGQDKQSVTDHQWRLRGCAACASMKWSNSAFSTG